MPWRMFRKNELQKHSSWPKLGSKGREIPVMLTEKACVDLAVFVPQSFSRPERKSLQFGPN